MSESKGTVANSRTFAKASESLRISANIIESQRTPEDHWEPCRIVANQWKPHSTSENSREPQRNLNNLTEPQREPQRNFDNFPEPQRTRGNLRDSWRPFKDPCRLLRDLQRSAEAQKWFKKPRETWRSLENLGEPWRLVETRRFAENLAEPQRTLENLSLARIYLESLGEPWRSPGTWEHPRFSSNLRELHRTSAHLDELSNVSAPQRTYDNLSLPNLAFVGELCRTFANQPLSTPESRRELQGTAANLGEVSASFTERQRNREHLRTLRRSENLGNLRESQRTPKNHR